MWAEIVRAGSVELMMMTPLFVSDLTPCGKIAVCVCFIFIGIFRLRFFCFFLLI